MLVYFNNCSYLCIAFGKESYMVVVVQLVRASDCGSECRGFESHQPPFKKSRYLGFLFFYPLRVDFAFFLCKFAVINSI